MFVENLTLFVWRSWHQQNNKHGDATAMSLWTIHSCLWATHWSNYAHGPSYFKPAANNPSFFYGMASKSIWSPRYGWAKQLLTTLTMPMCNEDIKPDPTPFRNCGHESKTKLRNLTTWQCQCFQWNWILYESKSHPEKNTWLEQQFCKSQAQTCEHDDHVFPKTYETCQQNLQAKCPPPIKLSSWHKWLIEQ